MDLIPCCYQKSFFYEDSKSSVKALELIEEDTLLFLFIAKSIDQLLTLFDLSLQEKCTFVTANEAFFKEEFNPDKAMNQAVKRKYRVIQQQLECFLIGNLEDEYQPLEAILKAKKKEIIPIIEEIMKYSNQQKVDALEENLIASYIHMMVNRAFRDQQRKYEWLLYNYLSKAYRTRLFRK